MPQPSQDPFLALTIKLYEDMTNNDVKAPHHGNVICAFMTVALMAFLKANISKQHARSFFESVIDNIYGQDEGSTQ